MKLYLSSYKIGDRTDVLREWLRNSDSNKICLIASARDIFPDGEIKTIGIQNDAKELEDLGFEVILLDLRKFFGKKEELQNYLREIHAFYVVGGNAFVLRKAMKLSGFDELLLEYVNNPKYLYAGYSAGICCLCKDMRAVAVMDEPLSDPYNSNLAPIYNGIGFIDEVLIPHFESDHSETELASMAVKFCQENDIPYCTLRDGDVIIKNYNILERKI